MASPSLGIPGFVIGGVTASMRFAEAACQIWRSFDEAGSFGSNVSTDVAKLSMEYYRFEAWCNAVNMFLQSRGQDATARAPQSAVEETCFGGARNAVESAFTEIVKIMEEVKRLLQQYQQSPDTESGGAGSAEPVFGNLASILPNISFDPIPSLLPFVNRGGVEQVSFRKRFTYSTSPWKESDRKALQRCASDLFYWNESLEVIFPTSRPDSLKLQAVAAKLLGNSVWDRDALQALTETSGLRNDEILHTASLWNARRELELVSPANGSTGRELEKAIGEYEQSDPSESRLQGRLGNLKLAKEDGSTGPTAQDGESSGAVLRVITESYPFDANWDNKAKSLARQRLTKLSYILSRSENPHDLRILKCHGFAEDLDKGMFVIFFGLPRNAHAIRPPLFLNDLFSGPNAIRAALSVRLTLARQLAASLYSFHLVRWFHKAFASHNIAIFHDNTGRLSIDSPCVLGFDLSRPEDAPSLSFKGGLRLSEIYLHPLLRVQGKEKRPEYHRRFDIYSLGLLLWEIGTWTSLAERYGKANLAASDLRKKIVERAKTDLPFYMGTKYRDVVLRCITGEDAGDDSLTTSLEAFYWLILFELAKCQCSE